MSHRSNSLVRFQVEMFNSLMQAVKQRQYILPFIKGNFKNENHVECLSILLNIKSFLGRKKWYNIVSRLSTVDNETHEIAFECKLYIIKAISRELEWTENNRPHLLGGFYSRLGFDDKPFNLKVSKPSQANISPTTCAPKFWKWKYFGSNFNWSACNN